MPPPLLALQNVALSFGGTPLLTSAELIVAPGDRIALVGRNGSGKSTLLKIAAGRFSQTAATGSYIPARLFGILRRKPFSPAFERHLSLLKPG